MHLTKYRGGDKVTNVEKRKNGRNLVNNEELKEMVRTYQNMCNEAEANGKELPQVPENLGKALLTICISLSQRYNFYNYSWRDEMISDAVIKQITALRKFNCDAGTSCFAYFVQTAWFEMVSRIKLENKQRTIKASIVQSMGIDVKDMELQDIDEDADYKTSIQEFSSLMDIDLSDIQKKSTPKRKQQKKMEHEFF